MGYQQLEYIDSEMSFSRRGVQFVIASKVGVGESICGRQNMGGKIFNFIPLAWRKMRSTEKVEN